MNNTECKVKIEKEKEEMEKCNKFLQSHKNEKLNSNGICQETSIMYIHFRKLFLSDKSVHDGRFYVKAVFNGQEQQTTNLEFNSEMDFNQQIDLYCV